jgi:TatD DNase family protein
MIDTHCHLIDPQFSHDLASVCVRAQEAGITYAVNAGYDLSTSEAACRMHESIPWALPAVGIHPNEIAVASISRMGGIKALAGRCGVIAIGETGLDFYRDRSPRDAQEELFRLHISLSREMHLPLLIHTRNSIDRAIAILDKEPGISGVFHCFSGTIAQAMRIVYMGFSLGFGGILTFSKQTREVFNAVPLEHVVLETDAPFLAPAAHRGHRNEPAYMKETLNAAAAIIDRPIEYVERVTDENAQALFKIQKSS